MVFKKNIFLTIRKLFTTFILYRSEFLKILPKTEVVSIFVEKKYRNKKIATTLLNKVEIFLKKKKIEAYFVKTFKTKKIALRFYKMNDFVILNKNKPLNNKVYILLKQL